MGKFVRKLRPLMTVVDLTDDQKNSSAKRAAPSGTPDCEASARAKQRAKTVSANRAAGQPTGRRESANRKARVSQQEGASQPTGRRDSANHPGNQNYLVFGLAELSKFTSQNLRLAAL